MDDIRKRIRDFLHFMRWSESALNKQLGWPRGRVNYILTHPASRITVEESAQVEAVIAQKTPTGEDGPAPIPKVQISNRENLLTALVLFASETESEKLRRMCSELAHAIAEAREKRT